MKKSELRIDNWVNFGDTQVQVDFITKYDNMLIDKCQPIPITEEWLVKFGFFKDPQDHWSMILSLGGHTNMTLSSSFTLNSVTLIDRQNLSTGIHVDYVHQLQNLYFALTGNELTFKK